MWPRFVSMTPVEFTECNFTFGPPADLEESQCKSIRVWAGHVNGGSVDGSPCIVSAWRPAPDEIEAINRGEPIFISFMGAFMPPHFVSTSFAEATHPS